MRWLAVVAAALVAVVAFAGLALGASGKPAGCPSGRCATVVRADPPPANAQSSTVVLGARLFVRRGGSRRPLSGKTLTFFIGGLRACAAKTDRHGHARCEIRACPTVAAAVAKGFAVRFTGAPGLRPSKARGTVSPRRGTARASTPGCRGGSKGPGSSPSASFTFSPASPVAGQIVTFYGSATTPRGVRIDAYQWSFGDGATGTGKTAKHAFAAGSYKVTLKVTAANGLSGSTTRTVTVRAASVPSTPAFQSLPTASFTFSPPAPNAGQTVSFDGSASKAPGSSVASYQWDFGDGATGSGAQPGHAYGAAGSYTVTLTVTAANGLTGATSRTVTVSPAPVAPTAAFTFSPGGPTAGQAVSFDGSGSTAPGSSISSYQWDFGDGGSGTGVQPSHSYSSDGSYTVTLTVTAANGLTGTTTEILTVGAAPVPPIASFTFSAPVANADGSLVSFDASGSSAPGSSITSYQWNFGDGTTGSGVKPTHRYQVGSYKVTLTVTAANGLSGSTSKTVTIITPPRASFTYSQANPTGTSTLYFNYAVNFDASGSSASGSSITGYQWNFGDGVTGSGVRPTHTYTGTPCPQPGPNYCVYTVTLTVTAANGLTGSTTQSLTVYSLIP
jgi:PKD repeat protein